MISKIFGIKSNGSKENLAGAKVTFKSVVGGGTDEDGEIVVKGTTDASGNIITNTTPINGTGNNNLGDFPRLVDNFSASYAYGDHTISGIAHYRSGIDSNVNTTLIGYIATSSMTTIDLSYTYQVSDKSSVQVGCINCGDRDPIFDPGPGEEAGYFKSLDDPRGAVVYARWTQEF